MILALALEAFAVPTPLTHTGRVYDATTGVPVTGFHDVTASIYDGASPSATALWSDDIENVEFEDGYFSVRLGQDVSAPLDDSLFDNSTMYIAIRVDGGTETARLPIDSVPFARRAGSAATADMATSVSGGGVVDASEIQINGTTVIDGSGSFTGGGETLGNLTCAANQIAIWDGGDWVCGAAPSASTDWTQITNKPLDFDDDVDNDMLAGISCPAGDLIRFDGTDWACSGTDWAQLTGIPFDIDNGDDFESLGTVCADGEIPRWNTATGWICDTDIDTDTVLADADVISIVESNAVDLDSGTTLGGASILTSIDEGDMPFNGLNEVSNGLISNQPQTNYGGAAALPIPDNFPLGVTDTVSIPSHPDGERIFVAVDLANSDIAGIQVQVVDPDGIPHILYANSSSGPGLSALWPEPDTPDGGNLDSWNGRDPAGDWSLQVVDSIDDSLVNDGQINSWSITVQDLSSTAIEVNGAATISGVTNILDALTVDADVTINQNLTVLVGTATLADADITTLDVTGVSTLADADVTTLDVTGTSTLADADVTTLDVTGTATLADADVTTLDVTGTSTLSDTVIGGTITVGGRDVTDAFVPVGAIMAFNDTVCPTGWSAADGGGTTLDLRGRFPIGAGALPQDAAVTIATGDSGGSHRWRVGADGDGEEFAEANERHATVGVGFQWDGEAQATANNAGTGNFVWSAYNNHLPPFSGVLYCQKN